MNMTISVVGSGYVGLAIGMGLAEQGYNVIFVDIDENRIQQINEGKSPIHEDDLSELMQKLKDNYSATSDYNEAVQKSDVTFISVGTPSKDDGSIDLEAVKSAVQALGSAIKFKTSRHEVIVKSTVIPGTTENVLKPILEEFSGKTAFSDFGLIMNPEFLREGKALSDFRNPDRIVIGTENDMSRGVMKKIYNPFGADKLLFVDIKTAEMIKYASNGFLATKISFANEIGNLCKKIGIDTDTVFEGVGRDKRINPEFFEAGLGFGGSCFPKDLEASIKIFKDFDEKPRILEAVQEVNKEQISKFINLLIKKVHNLNNKTFGILGLAFKPESDDVRDTRAKPIIEILIEKGANIISFDPEAMEKFKKIYPEIGTKIKYTNSAQELLDITDTLLILTKWPEFEKLDYSGKTVIDGRRVKAAEKTVDYEGICW